MTMGESDADRERAYAARLADDPEFQAKVKALAERIGKPSDSAMTVAEYRAWRENRKGPVGVAGTARTAKPEDDQSRPSGVLDTPTAPPIDGGDDERTEDIDDA